MAETKRPLYFTSQFLVEGDFKAEQDYHGDLRRLHNISLHTWGIVKGLDVTKTSTPRQVAISAGLAIDSAGREIVIAQERAPQNIDLSAGTTVFIIISYSEELLKDDLYTGAGLKDKFTRATLRPKLSAVTSAPDDGSVIKLARATVTDDDIRIDNSVRRLASSLIAKGSSLELDSVSLTGNLSIKAGKEIVFADNGQIRSFDNNHRLVFNRAANLLELHELGDIRFLTGNPPSEKLRINSAGNVGIGTANPAEALEANGRLKSGALTIGPWPANPNYVFFGTNAVDQTAAGNYALLQGADSDKGITFLNSPENIRFRIGNADKMILTKEGNVGIGTASPSAGRRLAVDGNTTILAELSNWGEGLRIIAKGSNRFAATIYGRADEDAKALWFTGIGSFPSNNRESDLVFLSGPGRGAPDTAQFGSSSLGGAYRGDTVMALEHNTGNALFGAKIGIGTASPNGLLDVANLVRFGFDEGGSGPRVITFARDAGDEVNAGKIAYKPSWDASVLGIVGAGSSPRKIRMWDDVLINGRLQVLGPKTGYVADQFVNNIGETLEQGDVVVIGANQASLFYGLDNTIPIAEVDLTDTAYDSRVCGIVCEAYGKLVPDQESEQESKSKKSAQAKAGKKPSGSERMRPQEFTGEEREALDRAKVEPGQIGFMVTLGAFAHCKVDADIAPISVGDLLTTSSTKGHAQKVLDTNKSTGAIIGKALQSLKKGKGKIPVIVTL